MIAALAAEHELTVIEDTVLDELCFDADPGTPIWALAPERVFAAGSLSKVAWGGLRVGWLRAPRPVILRLARIKGALNIGVGAFDQLAALAILDDYPSLCQGRRTQANTHMHAIVDALRRELPEWIVPASQGGWSLWLTPPAGSGAAFAQAALRHGVAIAPGGASSPDEAFPEYVRVCYGPSPPVLEAAAQDSPPHGATSRAQLESLALSAPEPAPPKAATGTRVRIGAPNKSSNCRQRDLAGPHDRIRRSAGVPADESYGDQTQVRDQAVLAAAPVAASGRRRGSRSVQAPEICSAP